MMVRVSTIVIIPPTRPALLEEADTLKEVCGEANMAILRFSIRTKVFVS